MFSYPEEGRKHMCVHRFWETYVVVGSGGRTEHPVYPAALGCVSHDMNVNAQQIPNSVLKPSNKRERRDHSNKCESVTYIYTRALDLSCMRFLLEPNMQVLVSMPSWRFSSYDGRDETWCHATDTKCRYVHGMVAGDWVPRAASWSPVEPFKSRRIPATCQTSRVDTTPRPRP